MKATIIEVKISLEEFRGRCEQVKERMGELEQKEKRLKKSKQNLKGLGTP